LIDDAIRAADGRTFYRTRALRDKGIVDYDFKKNRPPGQFADRKRPILVSAAFNGAPADKSVIRRAADVPRTRLELCNFVHAPLMACKVSLLLRCSARRGANASSAAHVGALVLQAVIGKALHQALDGCRPSRLISRMMCHEHAVPTYARATAIKA